MPLPPLVTDDSSLDLSLTASSSSFLSGGGGGEEAEEEVGRAESAVLEAVLVRVKVRL